MTPEQRKMKEAELERLRQIIADTEGDAMIVDGLVDVCDGIQSVFTGLRIKLEKYRQLMVQENDNNVQAHSKLYKELKGKK